MEEVKEATAEEVREAPAEEMKVSEEAPKMVEELKRQPSAPPLSQQPEVEEKGSDATANGANHAEGIVFCSYLCIGCLLHL